METSKNGSFVVKRYAVREAEKWRYTERKAKIGRYAVRKGGGGVTLIIYRITTSAQNDNEQLHPKIRNFKDNNCLYIVDNVLPILKCLSTFILVYKCPSHRHSRSNFRPVLGGVLYG